VALMPGQRAFKQEGAYFGGGDPEIMLPGEMGALLRKGVGDRFFFEGVAEVRMSEDESDEFFQVGGHVAEAAAGGSSMRQ
jgi:hypothetical protein